jgi:Dyp-type peroxidase family
MSIFEPRSDLVTGPVVPGAPPEPLLDIDQIQGNVLPGFNTRRQWLLGIRFRDAARARAWLGGVLGEVSTLAEVIAVRNLRRAALCAGEDRPPTPTWTSVAFSSDGLRLLTDDVERVREAAFKIGMAEQGGLGDPPRGLPGHRSGWVVGGSPERTPHALVTLGADDGDQIAAAVAAVTAALAPGELIFDQPGVMLDGGKEHFGFRDGVSQPGVRGRLSDGERHYLTRRYVDPADERALALSRPGQPLVWPGQFVFGYEGQRNDDPLRPGAVVHGGPEWTRNGSFLVFRRLRQDVATFRSELARLADVAGVSSELLAAKLVGRWPGGTAMARSTTGDEPDPMADRMAVNFFGFDRDLPAIGVSADPCAGIEDLSLVRETESEVRTVEGSAQDEGGLRCPRFAHVRKVNPRDIGPTDKGGSADTLARAILRRGITWGSPYPDDPAAQAADDGNRGLLFLSYQTGIKEQFQVLNNDWMNQAGAPEGNAGHDLLVGQHYEGDRGVRQATLRSDGTEVRLATDRHWVVPTGGGYFFTPSVDALHRFAGA